MVVWMEVTRDEYELPVAVADSADELAKICGVSVNCIRVHVYRHESGLTNTKRFIRVDIGEPDDDAEEDYRAINKQANKSYRILKQNNLCYECGTNKAEPGENHCSICKLKKKSRYAESQRKARMLAKEAQSNGKCD